MGRNKNLKQPNIKDEWETPDWLFDILDEMYRFQVDLAATEENSKHRHYLSDSLNQDWRGYSFGFCNPPYSNIPAFIEKALEERGFGLTTCMVIPDRTDVSKIWPLADQADEIWLLNPRVSFCYKGVPQSGNEEGTAILHFRPRVPGVNYGGAIYRSWSWKEAI